MNSMILAASGFLPIVTNILLVILVAVALLLCLVVLMQRPKQEGLGAAFGGGMTDQAFGARTTDVLQKGTVWLGTIFFVLALSLQVLVAAQNSGQNVVKEDATTEEANDDEKTQTPAPTEIPVEPVTPAAPVETPATNDAAPAESAEETTDATGSEQDETATEEATPAEVPAETTPVE